MRRRRSFLAILLAGALLAPALRADEPPPPEPDTPDEPAAEKVPPLPGSSDELAGITAVVQSQWVKARELGEKILKSDPTSIPGHFILGAALHHGEGDLPRALYHLQIAVDNFDKQSRPADAPSLFQWHGAALMDLASVLGEMERCEDQLRLLDEHDRRYEPKIPAARIWPLMKLKRYDEARAAAAAAIATGDPRQRKAARADLCGAESEAGDRKRAYETCTEATRDFRGNTGGGQLEFSNAADAALEVLRHDESEVDLKEAIARPGQIPWVNPYAQLVELYLTEGRVAEAIEAMRGAQQLRQSHPAAFDQFVEARIDAALTELFLVTGIGDRAVAAARRAAERPDRQGHSSGNEAQSLSAAEVLYALALHEQAVRLEEDAVTSTWFEAAKLRARAAWLRLSSWRARRRAAVLLADERLLARSLRPYYLGMAFHPWMLAEAIDTVGAGVTRAALARAREEDKDFPAAEKYFAAWDAEAAWVRGDCKTARPAAVQAAMNLPRAEVMLLARMHALAASCALRDGEDDQATASLSMVLAKDPGLMRRLGLVLPVAIEPDGSELADRAARLVRRSPRFRREDASAFRVTLSGGSQPRACLFGPSNAQIACASVNLPVDTADDAGARLLVAEFHRTAFALKADLSQADLTSLDGSPTAARADQRVRSVLDKLGDPAPHLPVRPAP